MLALAVYGTIELIDPAGAGAGQGPQPIFKNGLPPAASTTSWSPNSNNILQVQVIGQQWAWTYRYPQFGGFETTQLVLPVGQPVEFNVTSLDVIHSFWAYQLGVKADANPGVNNVAYTTAKQPATSRSAARSCAGSGTAPCTTPARSSPCRSSMAWPSRPNTKLASLTKIAAAVRADLRPDDIPAGKISTGLGLTSAGGGYYNPNDLEQP